MSSASATMSSSVRRFKRVEAKKLYSLVQPLRDLCDYFAFFAVKKDLFNRKGRKGLAKVAKFSSLLFFTAVAAASRVASVVVIVLLAQLLVRAVQDHAEQALARQRL